jgi:tetratricopeptide (TPR) repeat protein
MDCCARLNNVGASQLVSGMYANAVDSFTESLRIAKTALAVLAAERQITKSGFSCSLHQQQQRRAVVLFKDSIASGKAPEAKLQPVVDHHDKGASRGLYISPLFLSESSADYQRYEPTVDASIAIMFNLALAHHLNAIYGSFNRSLSTLEQAIALYELAYSVHMQEDADLNIEFTMAIINNLGHLHRLLGDEQKASQCFQHLLSTILFLRSYGGQHPDCICRHTDTFVYSVSHLILRETAAAAA